jgi:hypothetical protein
MPVGGKWKIQFSLLRVGCSLMNVCDSGKNRAFTNTEVVNLGSATDEVLAED